MRKIRARYKSELITTKETIPVVIRNKKENVKAMYGCISDQSPKINRFFHWKNFMNIHVPVITGGEMLAKKCDLSVCYLKGEKIKRGHYQGTFVPLAENPNDYPDFQITDMFMEEVEKQVYKAPEYYLWTHKRFKHRDKSPNLIK